MAWGLRNALPGIALLLVGASVGAQVRDIEAVLAQETPPEGVVFEIVDRDPQALRWAIPAVREQATRLRERFPGVSLAVVTHGSEQFALQSVRRDSQATVHEGVRALVEQEGVAVHVCGTFAEWRGVVPEDFPDYVDVAPAGPAQINNYKALGYVVVRVGRP